MGLDGGMLELEGWCVVCGRAATYHLCAICRMDLEEPEVDDDVPMRGALRPHLLLRRVETIDPGTYL